MDFCIGRIRGRVSARSRPGFLARDNRQVIPNPRGCGECVESARTCFGTVCQLQRGASSHKTVGALETAAIGLSQVSKHVSQKGRLDMSRIHDALRQMEAPAENDISRSALPNVHD